VTEPFGSEYADTYDRLYAGKDYGGECDLIAGVVPRPVGRAPRILDLGCGTGGHAVTLARRGFDVVGVDLSAPMIAIAKKKAEAQGLAIEWHVGDLADVRVSGRFDAVAMMFAVLGYLTETDRLRQAFRNARQHLDPGGKLIFDVWYGPAVLTEGPADRVKVIPQPDGSVIRAVTPTLRSERNVVDVHTRLWRVAQDRVVVDSAEIHQVRYYFIPELEALVGDAGFSVERFFAFPDLSAPIRQSDWNLGCVARAT
jgi:SAM-dependent methyltransferase